MLSVIMITYLLKMNFHTSSRRNKTLSLWISKKAQGKYHIETLIKNRPEIVNSSDFTYYVILKIMKRI